MLFIFLLQFLQSLIRFPIEYSKKWHKTFNAIVTGIPSAKSEDVKNTAVLEQIPGVFVKEILSEPCLDIRLTKRTVSFFF